MDKGTVIGITLTLILILATMALGGSILMFFNIPSVLTVFLGTLAITLATDDLGVTLSAWKVALNAVFEKSLDGEEVLETVIRMSGIARANGVLALENEQVPPGFMEKGLRLLCDGMAPDELGATLDAELKYLKKRHERGQAIFRFMQGTAPAMGMIGTLIGLVAMLQTLDDPSKIGPSMAVALLTTLYGAIIAYGFCNPIATKLERRTTNEEQVLKLCIAGYVAIAKGDNPMVIREKLNAFLAPDDRKSEARD